MADPMASEQESRQLLQGTNLETRVQQYVLLVSYKSHLDKVG
jgi:hypothetical protein